MTGFGRSIAGESQNKIEVQIKSVNSRFLDLKFRGLNIDLSLEDEIRNQISKSLYICYILRQSYEFKNANGQ